MAIEIFIWMTVGFLIGHGVIRAYYYMQRKKEKRYQKALDAFKRNPKVLRAVKHVQETMRALDIR